jgi:hypothetical protein
MAISLGPKLGLLNNANIGEAYYDQLRMFLQAIDALLQASVISASVAVPPSTPNNGDAYVLSPTPSGVWTGYQGYIAIWNTQVTSAGTNNQVPSWVFYKPQPGWVIWNVALQGLYVYTGTVWIAIGGGITPIALGGTGATSAPIALTNLGAAASGVNNDITALDAVTSAASTSGQAGITIESAGGNGNALVVSNGIQTSTLTTNGTLSVSSIGSAGVVTCGGLQSSAAVTSNQLSNATPGTPISVITSGGGTLSFVINGTGVDAQALLGFVSYPTRTVVGSAGSASALPSAPLGYLEMSVDGTIVVFPYYTKA